MLDEKKFADEVMSDEELDQVAGGTSEQNNEIFNAISTYNPRLAKQILNERDELMKTGHTQKYSMITALSNALRNKYLIDMNSYDDKETDNSYVSDNSVISHQEVLDTIKHACV